MVLGTKPHWVLCEVASPHSLNSNHANVISIGHQICTVNSTLGRLAWNKQPPQSDEDTNASTDTKGTGGTYGIQDGAPGESTDEESSNANNFMVAGNDTAVQPEKIRVSHQFAPDCCQHN